MAYTKPDDKIATSIGGISSHFDQIDTVEGWVEVHYVDDNRVVINSEVTQQEDLTPVQKGFLTSFFNSVRAQASTDTTLNEDIPPVVDPPPE